MANRSIELRHDGYWHITAETDDVVGNDQASVPTDDGSAVLLEFGGGVAIECERELDVF